LPSPILQLYHIERSVSSMYKRFLFQNVAYTTQRNGRLRELFVKAAHKVSGTMHVRMPLRRNGKPRKAPLSQMPVFLIPGLS
jgi:hypothetical protein